MSASLTGRRVLVTGANGSLGSATVAALRDRGARVIGLDLVEGDHVIACDVCDQEAVTAAVARARDLLDGIDSAVHFAGIGVPTSAGEAPGDAVMRTLDVNLLGAWRVTAACIDDLVARRGRLVFVASELAYATIPFATAYSVSKRGRLGLDDAPTVSGGRLGR
jgi:NAD(P)-dependent dehydrogenase (short-subunit alcohol dehydrogenase family)